MKRNRMRIDDLVYYDTNVWVAYALGSQDHFYSVCKPLITDIENGRKTAVVSYLILMETIHVLRTKIAKSKSMGDDTSIHQKTNVINETVNQFIEWIDSLAKQQKIVFAETDKNILDHYSIIFKKLRNYFGNLIPPSPDNASSKKFEYKGLNHNDIEHAYFAMYSKAPTFYSTDKSFSDLLQDPDFSSITFNILEHDP